MSPTVLLQPNTAMQRQKANNDIFFVQSYIKIQLLDDSTVYNFLPREVQLSTYSLDGAILLNTIQTLNDGFEALKEIRCFSYPDLDN